MTVDSWGGANVFNWILLGFKAGVIWDGSLSATFSMRSQDPGGLLCCLPPSWWWVTDRGSLSPSRLCWAMPGFWLDVSGLAGEQMSLAWVSELCFSALLHCVWALGCHPSLAWHPELGAKMSYSLKIPGSKWVLGGQLGHGGRAGGDQAPLWSWLWCEQVLMH